MTVSCSTQAGGKSNDYSSSSNGVIRTGMKSLLSALQFWNCEKWIWSPFPSVLHLVTVCTVPKEPHSSFPAEMLVLFSWMTSLGWALCNFKTATWFHGEVHRRSRSSLAWVRGTNLLLLFPKCLATEGESRKQVTCFQSIKSLQTKALSWLWAQNMINDLKY